MVAGLLIFGIIGRHLGPVGAGHFAYAVAILQVGLGLSLICTGSALLPRFCRIGAALPGAIANVFALRMAAALLAALVVAAFTVFVVEDAQRRTVCLVLLGAIPLIEPFAVIATYWSSRNQNRPNVVARSTGLLARLAVVAVGVALGAPVWLLAAAWVLEAAINAGIQTLQLRSALAGKSLHRFVRASRTRGYLRFGARFVLGSWLHVLYTRLDRLILAERTPPEVFGLYATAMQLVDVWAQVAHLIAVSLATALLYRQIRAGRLLPAVMGTAAVMTTIGLVGLGAVWCCGSWFLTLVFGPNFADSQPYLLSGTAMAVLLFVNQTVQLTMAALNRPTRLVVMWAVAVAVASLAIWIGQDRIGLHAGPAGLALGMLAGWLSLLAWPRWR